MATKIFIGRLHSNTQGDELEEDFKKFGNIKKLDAKMNFAFIEYEDPRDAEDAINEMNEKPYRGSERIVVQIAKGPRENNAPRIPKSKFRLVVEGLSHRTSWQDLKDFAREAGKPIYTDVSNKNGEKVGIIEYETADDMDNAIRKLDDTELHGSRVRIFEERLGRSGGGGGRGNSRDRGSRGDSRDRGGRDRDYGRDDRRGGGDRDRDRDYGRDDRRGGGGRDDYRDDRGSRRNDDRDYDRNRGNGNGNNRDDNGRGRSRSRDRGNNNNNNNRGNNNNNGGYDDRRDNGRFRDDRDSRGGGGGYDDRRDNGRGDNRGNGSGRNW